MEFYKNKTQKSAKNNRPKSTGKADPFLVWLVIELVIYLKRETRVNELKCFQLWGSQNGLKSYEGIAVPETTFLNNLGFSGKKCIAVCPSYGLAMEGNK